MLRSTDVPVLDTGDDTLGVLTIWTGIGGVKGTAQADDMVHAELPAMAVLATGSGNHHSGTGHMAEANSSTVSLDAGRPVSSATMSTGSSS